MREKIKDSVKFLLYTSQQVKIELFTECYKISRTEIQAFFKVLSCKCQLAKDEKNFVSCFCKACTIIRAHNRKLSHIRKVEIQIDEASPKPLIKQRRKRLRVNIKRSTKEERPQLSGVLFESSAVLRVRTKTDVCHSLEDQIPSEFRSLNTSTSTHAIFLQLSTLRISRSVYLRMVPDSFLVALLTIAGAQTKLSYRHT